MTSTNYADRVAEMNTATGFVSRIGFAEELKVSEDTVRGWCDRHWTKGKEYFVVGKTTMIDKKEAIRWLESRKVSSSGQGLSGSSSTTRARGSRRLIQGPAMQST